MNSGRENNEKHDSNLADSRTHQVSGQQGGEQNPKNVGFEKSIAMQVASGATLRIWKDSNDNTHSRLKFHPFEPNFAGLIAARKVCRSEMAKIVNEVDLVTKEPKLALDTRRDDHFLDPLIYRQLLPVSRFDWLSWIIS